MTNSSTYLWGKDFLITPILKDSVASKEIYFPNTANWFNFYTDEKVIGGQTKSVELDEATIPTYVRGGAFIPMAKLVQTTDAYKSDVLEVHYYLDASVKESKRTFYNDNGLLSKAFEKGAYEILEFESKLTKCCLEFEMKAAFGENWNPEQKEITLVLHNINWNPKKIKVDGKRKRILSEKNTLTILLNWNPKKELKVKILLK